jgi:hypothetical protein
MATAPNLETLSAKADVTAPAKAVLAMCKAWDDMLVAAATNDDPAYEQAQARFWAASGRR